MMQIATKEDMLHYHRLKVKAYNRRIEELNGKLVGYFSEGARLNKLARAQNRIEFHRAALLYIKQSCNTDQ